MSRCVHIIINADVLRHMLTDLRAIPSEDGLLCVLGSRDPADTQSLCEVSTLVSDQIIGFQFVSRIHMYFLTQQIPASARRV